MDFLTLMQRDVPEEFSDGFSYLLQISARSKQILHYSARLVGNCVKRFYAHTTSTTSSKESALLSLSLFQASFPDMFQQGFTYYSQTVPSTYLHYTHTCSLIDESLPLHSFEFTWDTEISAEMARLSPCLKCANRPASGRRQPQEVFLLLSSYIRNIRAREQYLQTLSKRKKEDARAIVNTVFGAKHYVASVHDLLEEVVPDVPLEAAFTALQKLDCEVDSITATLHYQASGKAIRKVLFQYAGIPSRFQTGPSKQVLVPKSMYKSLLATFKVIFDDVELNNNALRFMATLWVFCKFDPLSQTWKGTVPVRLLESLPEFDVFTFSAKSPLTLTDEETITAFMEDGIPAEEAVATARALG